MKEKSTKVCKEIDMLSKEKNDVYNLKESCIQNDVGGQHAVVDKNRSY